MSNSRDSSSSRAVEIAALVETVDQKAAQAQKLIIDELHLPDLFGQVVAERFFARQKAVKSCTSSMPEEVTPRHESASRTSSGSRSAGAVSLGSSVS